MPDYSYYEDPDQREFFEELGRALSVFGGLEAILGEIYAIGISGGRDRASRYAYWTVQSIEGRLSMTAAVVHVLLDGDKDLVDAWDSLQRRVIRKKTLRNHIAHGTVVTGPAPKIVRLKTSIMKDFSAVVAGQPESGKEYTLKEVREIRRGFWELTRDLMDFRRAAFEASQKPRDPGTS